MSPNVLTLFGPHRTHTSVFSTKINSRTRETQRKRKKLAQRGGHQILYLPPDLLFFHTLQIFLFRFTFIFLLLFRSFSSFTPLFYLVLSPCPVPVSPPLCSVLLPTTILTSIGIWCPWSTSNFTRLLWFWVFAKTLSRILFLVFLLLLITRRCHTLSIKVYTIE